MTDLFIKVKTQQEQNLPFVIFCKPNSDKIVGLFQRNDHLYFLENFEEKGFVFAPFDANDFPFLPLEYSDVFVENVNSKDFFVSNVSSVSENLEENLKTASTEAKKSIKAAIKYLKEKNLPITLTSIAEERIRLAGERIISENKELRDKLDIGFRVFEFGNSTLNQWDENPVKFDDQLELLGISPFTGSSTNDERATEIAIKSGIPLDVNPTVSNDVYHYVSGDKEVFIVLGNYDESLFGNLDKKRSLQVATIVLRELEDGSELKFNLIESLKQNEILNNHLNVEWL